MSDGFRYDLIPAGTTVLCALSGGADSMYLLCRLLDGAEAGGYAVRCAHYNHRLRDTARRDEMFVREQCALRDISLTVGSGDVAAECARRGLGMEECARQMRYRFLEETAEREGCTLIATGHHAGDNAETVLMNLIRGCGLKGLTGIPERRGKIIRPMLGITRAEIDACLAARGIHHVEDETNADECCTRNRVRHTILPLLEELNPRASAHINEAAARLREDEAELCRQAAELLADAEPLGDGWSIPVKSLTRVPRPIALRAVGQLMTRTGLSGQAVHLEHIMALAAADDPSGGLDLPGGRGWREYDRLVLSAAGAADAPPVLPLADGVRWGSWTVECRPEVCPEKAYVSPGEFFLRPGAYSIRSRRTGDRLRLGPRPEKTIKKLLIDEKIPLRRRECLPVLDCGGNAAALGGFGPNRNWLARPGEPAVHIILTEEKEL